MQDGVDLFGLPDLLDRVTGWFDFLPPNLGDMVADVATIAGVTAMCVGILFVAWREIMTYRALRPDRRRRYLVRPTGTYEWSRDELERWGSQLAGIRRRVRRIQDRPAQAVRVRLAATPNGVTYTIEGSVRMVKTMRNPVLPGVVITGLKPRPQRGAPNPSPDVPSTTRARP